MSGIYIHIPFCKQACHYCNFHFSTSLRKKEALLQSLHKEIELSSNIAGGGSTILQSETIETIYFGGGTPSILEAGEIDLLLKKIKDYFPVQTNSEITLEANPDDISEEKLKAWMRSGINRLSIGVQSFFEEDLRWMNRAHNAQQAIENLQLTKKYFENITIDLIYGLPELTDERWKQNVKMAVNIGIPHLSCYALTVEPKTPLDKLIRINKRNNVDADNQSEQFLLLMQWASDAGYEHYEISNFTKPGYRSRHNSSYWQGKKYYGFGPSAHSYNGKERMWNVANNQQYIDSIQSGVIPCEKELLTASQHFNEAVMISLRTIEGIDLSKFNQDDANYLIRSAKKFIQQNLLVLKNGTLQLTKEGKLLADGIAAELFRV